MPSSLSLETAPDWRRDWLRRPFAHRGLHDHGAGVIENTVSAVEAAIAANYGVEIDVRPCLGGAPVVFHDATLERLTHGTGRVDALSHQALKRIAYRQGQNRIASLNELLEIVAGRTPLLVEIKSDWDGSVDCALRVAETLERYKGPIAAMSFDPRIVAAVRNRAPSVLRGIVSERFAPHHDTPKLSALRRLSLRHLFAAIGARPQFVAYDIRALPALAPRFARNILRVPLLTWTVRTEEQRRRAERYADAMIFEDIRP